MPVSLDYLSATPPLWHANTFVTRAGKNISVQVRNRGQVAVTDARVEVWHAAGASAVPPKWNSKTGGTPNWTKATGGPGGPKTVNAWPAPATTFGQFKLPSATASYWVLAAATCAGDPANIDPATALPCTIGEARIADLVGGDNNLGLVKV